MDTISQKGMFTHGKVKIRNVSGKGEWEMCLYKVNRDLGVSLPFLLARMAFGFYHLLMK